MGALPHLLSVLKSKEAKIPPLFRKGAGIKIAIHKEFCTTKYITYIHTYKAEFDKFVKNDEVHEK